MTDELETQAPVIGSIVPAVPRSLRQSRWPRATDIAADAADVGWCRIAASSVIGLEHAATGTCRQDAYGIAMASGNAVCVVVADGLGSRPAAHLGAVLFCESVILASAAATSPPDPIELAMAASERTAKLAMAAYELPPNDILCVALVGVITPTNARLARIGDATAFRLDDGFVELFPSDPQSINVVKSAVPGSDVASAEPVTLATDAPIVIVSDGIATDLRTSPGVRTWLGDRWRQPLGPHAMADTLRYRRQGSHDDRTAVVLWPTVPDRRKTADPE